MQGRTTPARTATGTHRARGARVIGGLLLALGALGMCAAPAGAHTWRLENDFAASPDGVTAPANPFADSYTDPGVWTVGYSGGGTYSGPPEARSYSGIASFQAGTARDWHGPGNFFFSGETEGWMDEAGPVTNYPFIGNNAGASAVGPWPAESVFAHPAPDAEQELSRATVRWVSPVTGTVSIEAMFTALDCGGGDGVDYSIDRQSEGSSSFAHVAGAAVAACATGNNSASYTSTLSVHSGDAYYFSVGDGGNGSYLYDSTGVTLNISDGAADSMQLSAPARTSAAYRHAIKPIQVTGSDSDGDAVALSAANVPAGLGFEASTGTLSGAPTAPSGNYAITLRGDDGHGETLTRTLRMTIEKAACALTNKAALLAKPGTVTLSAKLTEAGTKTALAGREVGFTVAPISTLSAMGTSAITGSTGVAKAKMGPLGGEVYLVGAGFNGDADYNSCATAANEVVTVSSSTYVASGAGQIALPGKQTATFGFNATGVAESGEPFLLITPAGELSGGTITSLSKPSATSVTWTGTGGWGGANAEYTATASDPATGADTIAVTVTVEGATVWSSEGAKAVKGGDIKVH